MFLFPILWIAVSFLHIIIMKKRREEFLETFLLDALVIIIGLGAFTAFLGHTMYKDVIADEIGWPKGSPFQFEVAVANLSFSVLGILSIWFRGNFWLATAIGYATFCYGAAFQHIQDIIEKGNFSPLNAGVFLYVGDIILPTIILAMAITYIRMKK
jgi:hypothetical protein